jgi:hypothetical protein
MMMMMMFNENVPNMGNTPIWSSTTWDPLRLGLLEVEFNIGSRALYKDRI